MTTNLSPPLKAVDIALEAWARWAHGGATQLGWPPVTILGRLAAEGFTGAAHAAHLPEMPAHVLATEQAVLRLKAIERTVVVCRYTRWEPIEASARRCHMSAGRFRTLLHRARRDVAAFLDGAACVATQALL